MFCIKDEIKDDKRVLVKAIQGQPNNDIRRILLRKIVIFFETTFIALGVDRTITPITIPIIHMSIL